MTRVRDDMAALIPRLTCEGWGGGWKEAPPNEYKAESAGDCGGALCFRARMPMGVSLPLLRLVEGVEEEVEEARLPPPPGSSMLPGGGSPPSICISTELTEHRRLILGEDSSRLCVPGIWREGGGGGTTGANRGGGGAMEEVEEEEAW